MNFIERILKNRQITLTILLMVFAVGVYSLFTMPRREDPKLTVPQGLVIAYYPGATAAQVEEQVTRKLEQYLFQYEEVYKAKTTSTTRDGVVVVSVWLNDNVKKPEIFWSKLRHQLLISKSLDLPKGVLGPVVNSDFGDTEAMLISVESDKASYNQINEYAKLLEDNIRTIKATSKIKRLGQQKEQITIYFNPDKLSQYSISVQQIVKVLQSQNTISPTGQIETASNNISLYNSGYYKNIAEIENQIVGTAKTGEVVRLGDIAVLKREQSEPTSSITVNGHKAIIVAVQMNEGNNIVWFGDDVNKKIAEVQKQLPSDVKLTTIVNQPQMVNTNVSHFLREFLIAIIAVIVVIMLLLPFRVAAVAATAIPMTIATTFALLHTFGIELHQVSLISLIIVLGMVVDDAIVVTDNYVDLLDKGVKRWDAAWRSASELVVPILTATVTIIASFMPMIILTGAIGEFVHDLPVTVSLALASSFIVALVLTPLLCFFFIKKGVNSLDNKNRKTEKSFLLNLMQKSYDKAIDWCANHNGIVITGSLLTIILAILIFKFGIRQKFMPYAERNQFVVELWMPTGTKLQNTQQAIAKIENEIKNDKRLVSYATFTGTSAPRVYYNFAPEFPVTNYAQILINTTGNESTETFAHELSQKMDALVPEGTAQVKLMQQGQPMISPVEVRIFGDDIKKQKEIAVQVKAILRSKKGNYLVNDDFKEDFYGVNIQLKDNAARLGYTTSSISQLVYVASKGYSVSTMYESDKPVDIVLRMDADKRQSTQDLENIYVESPVTGASIPLRQIADIQPQWQTGRIMHRNGLRCITVRSEANDNVLPSELLAEIRPEIEKINLPTSYYIEYGGEYANQNEVISHLIIALAISLALIFLTLLFQFKNLKETFIIMFTIPLSLFGAILGLWLTGNNFGLTAFLGIISLSGIVVRNAIILIDYTNDMILKGMDIRTAAIESGKRRLRPIFLTAMAAAVGVFPMIISGSSLWSPLASVIAFGVIWSMLMSLLTVPILYSMIIKPKDMENKYKNGKKKSSTPKLPLKEMKISTIIVLSIIFSTNISAQQGPQKYTLHQIQEMALKNNRLLKIKQMQVNEKQQKVNEDKVKFFPAININGNYQYNNNLPTLTIEKGTFGELPMQYTLPNGTTQNVKLPMPAEDKSIEMGKHNNYNASVILYQPISQIPKINMGMNISKTDLAITQAEQTKAAMQIKQATEKLYYGLLILQKQREEAQLKIMVAKSRLVDAENAIKAGKAISSANAGINAALADEEQNLLKINIQQDDYMADLRKITGILEAVDFTLEEPIIDNLQTFPPIANADSLAIYTNKDLKIAKLTLKKAQYAIKAANYSYIPDMGFFGGYAYQKGNALFPENNTFVGVSFKWNLQDIFSNTYTKNQRNWQKQQAEENIANIKEQLNADVAKTYRRLSQSQELIVVAQKVVNYRNEEVKLQADKQYSGLNTNTDLLIAKSALAKSQADLYAAKLNYRITLTDLQILTGNY